MMILMSISLISSLILMFLTHPLSMGLILMIQTIIVTLSMGLFNLNFWYSYILFLVMIGGMLVLFIYMTSVASNEKFSFSLKSKMTLMLLFILIIMTIPLLDSYMININNIYEDSINNSVHPLTSLNKFLNYPMMMILILMIIYLLITLIAVVKITNIKQGPLRQTH
uniref:NADH-ubiquinone oxidoreductase chain 6 n=1 Tax=Osmoderma opicum TaxID=1884344 RepID=A0A1B2ALD0_9SCAR|nr:NADH dehydrogenase subunit 6 [Osmoderma opicum]ANY28001.1 NADH dehydrogenase subunit 6 [Osmoderma caeleste]